MERKHQIQKHLAHVPHDMYFDPDAMQVQFANQAGVIRDFFLFIVKRQLSTQNIFGQITFTAQEFCKEMGYNQNEMQRRLDIWSNKLHPPTLIDGHECDSLLEYSLFRAAKENVVFHRWSKDGNPMINTYQIFNSLEIIYDKSTKKKVKRHYSVGLSPQIFNEVFAKYFIVDYNEYKALAAKSSDATSSYRNFYIYLGGMVAISKSHNRFHFRTNVDKLAEVFNYEKNEPRYLKKSIKRTLDVIQGKLKFSYQYKFVPAENSQKRTSYDILFTFNQELFDDFEEKILGAFWKKLREALFIQFKRMETESIIDFRGAAIAREAMKPDSETFHDFWFNPEFKDIKQEVLNKMINEFFPSGL